jgi:hypothetical protein
MTDSASRPISFEERLDDSPVSHAMWLLWLLLAGLIALDSCDFFPIVWVAMPF